MARQRGQKSSSGCEIRSNLPDNGNHVSPSRSNGNDLNNRTRAAASIRSGQLGWPTGTCPAQPLCEGPDRSILGSERSRRADIQRRKPRGDE
ncbi:hypothetical protein [uncultured Muribaculum sp.]|uniref:hypothetical protein n=1 Tax=uncultured Muribaculum sp. TaxID=1918613 RepID=UPI00272D9DAF|nr:hypothetical protein [uncultured Muribaculum sp.]